MRHTNTCVRHGLFQGLSLLALVLHACTGYAPTAPPAATISFSLDLPTGTMLHILAHDENEQLLVDVTTENSAALSITLPPNRDVVGLRILASAGPQAFKAVVAEVTRADRIDIGTLDARSTALAQLVQQKLAGDGGSFSSSPPSAFRDLISQIAAGSETITELQRAVEDLLVVAKSAEGPPLFNALDAHVSQAAESSSEYQAEAAIYRAALAKASAELRVPIVCDASLIKVMFTVDASGNALDGNGLQQLIRQPPKSGKVYLAITVDDASPVADTRGALRSQMVPNDPESEMFDDGTHGDEAANDGVFTRVLELPRGMRVKYKYTNGSAGQGWTRAEEWPGNARLLEIRDVLSRTGQPDCLVIRRDAFGDEASNKNHVNLHSSIKASGGNLGFDQDLGGASAAPSTDGFLAGGLRLGDIRKTSTLTPATVAEARENGSCARCPAPLTAATDDDQPPGLVSARFLSTERVRVVFSEAMEYSSASDLRNYAIVDQDGKKLSVTHAAANGAQVDLVVGPPDLRLRYVLRVDNLLDASVKGNPLPLGTTVVIEPDHTAPTVLTVRSAPLRDLNPAGGADPTLGQVVVVTFDEVLDRSSAENTENYRITSLLGMPLEIKGAIVKRGREVWLVTEKQVRRRPYRLMVNSVRDLSRNPIASGASLAFDGFALFKMTFGAVPGFAFLDLDGGRRGLPPGERLYLTGTVLAVARDLQGNSIAIPGRTDVTGVPAFEMKPSDELFFGKPIYKISVLAPPGSYAWKVAHGLPGEWKSPPTTLVKVHKSLCTSADGSGVNIDPVSLTALGIPEADGSFRDALDYSAATLSSTGEEKPGPFEVAEGQSRPQPLVMFKRENPDEVCTARSGDVVCPPIVIGTWRDLAAFSHGQSKGDYDDGLLDVSPRRIMVDRQAPALTTVTVFSSYSVILSFDERLAADASGFRFSARDSANNPLTLSVKEFGRIGGTLLPHQVWLQTEEMGLGEPYRLRIEKVSDPVGNAMARPLEVSFNAPNRLIPDEDTKPPAISAVLPKSPTSLLVQFGEEVDAVSATAIAAYAISTRGGNGQGNLAGPAILAAELDKGRTAVLLTTERQKLEADYLLTVRDVLDVATPPNRLIEQVIGFKGFGDSTAPKLVFAQAIGPQALALAFDESVSALTAEDASSYTVDGLTITRAVFAADSARVAAAFSPRLTRYSDRVVVLHSSTMTKGRNYRVRAAGVHDLSGNPVQNEVAFAGVDSAPTVDVVISYRVSGSHKVAGILPPRAITVADLETQREGLFILGTTVSVDGLKKGDAKDSINRQLGGFPPEGQPLDGIEPQLLDNGQDGDVTANDGIYSMRIPNVPLGTSLLWKSFASFSESFMNANPQHAQAAFADAPLGPSVFSDGQEYPGNENAVRILGDANGDGVVYIRCLFGDEISYKKFTNTPPFVWVVDDVSWKN